MGNQEKENAEYSLENEIDLTEEEPVVLENDMFIFCTEKEEKTGSIKLSPPLGEESIIIRSIDDVETLNKILLDYFRK